MGSINQNHFSSMDLLQSKTIIEILRFRAENQSNRNAFIYLNDREFKKEADLTYSRLDQRARSIGSKLQDWEGERALLIYPPGLDFIEAFFGCLYAGIIAVPAYPPKRNQKLNRLLSIITDAEVTVLMTTNAVFDTLQQQWKEYTEISRLHMIATDTIVSPNQNWIPKKIEPEQLAFLQYTSGSTGTPKGVMITHNNILHNSKIIRQCFKDTSDSVGVSWLPPYHDMGLIGSIIQPVYVGALMVLMSPITFLKNPVRWLRAISNYRATTSGGPNFAYEYCVQKIKLQDLEGIDLSCWRTAFNGAEPIKLETLMKFSNFFANCGFESSAFLPCYGLAESTLLVTGSNKKRTVINKIDRVDIKTDWRTSELTTTSENQQLIGSGQTCLEQRLIIAHPENFTLCDDNQEGEIWIAGESVANGYWNQPQITQATFHAYLAETGEGPFLRTGDLGFVRAGELFVRGRLKDLIIIRGCNYYPQDIETTVEQSNLLFRRPGCCAAFTVDIGGQTRLIVVAEVDRQSNWRVSVDSRLAQIDIESDIKLDRVRATKSLIEDIRQSVVQNHGLQVYSILLLRAGTIPKTSSGKVQRFACRNGFLNKTLILEEFTS
jgi:acyl-CoA synthetase (AMP-forming)/AMP-acid ligase II